MDVCHLGLWPGREYQNRRPKPDPCRAAFTGVRDVLNWGNLPQNGLRRDYRTLTPRRLGANHDGPFSFGYQLECDSHGKPLSPRVARDSLTTRLASEQSALTVFIDRLTASVTLIEALGGGWSASQLQ